MKNQGQTKDIQVLKRQLGIIGATIAVVGSMVGTGIFWQPGNVLLQAGGNVWLGAAAWLTSGMIILLCVYTFSVMGRQYENMHGLVDYAEALVGKKYAYVIGWYFVAIYHTAAYALLAWITANFTTQAAGMDVTDPSTVQFRIFLTLFYMVAVFCLSYIVPKLPMRFHLGSTVARCIPIVSMGVIGVIAGLIIGGGEATQVIVPADTTVNLEGGSFRNAMFATLFAYGGWQAAAAFNSEVKHKKDGKKGFPTALIVGFIIVITLYTSYFIGVALSGDGYQLMTGDRAQATREAFINIFGAPAGTILMIFIVISGLGILNLCCMGMSRSMFALGKRGWGPLAHRTGELDPHTNVPSNGMVVALGMSMLWFIVIMGNVRGWWGLMPDGRNFEFALGDFFNFMLFIFITPILFMFFIKHRKNKSLHIANRVIMPLVATAAAIFLASTLLGSFIHFVVYLSTAIVITVIGLLFTIKNKINSI